MEGQDGRGVGYSSVNPNIKSQWELAVGERNGMEKNWKEWPRVGWNSAHWAFWIDGAD